ncbi:MAG: RNA methyltransferase [Gemmatimonadota bacterium]
MQGLSDAKRRLIRRLRDRKGRSREGLVLLEGPRTVSTAREAGARIRFALLETGRRDDGLGQALEAEGVSVLRLHRSEIEALSDTESPQGVLAVAEEPRPQLPDPQEDPVGLLSERILLLDAIQDPGNVGTLIRAAAAFGLDRVIALDGTVDPWNPKVVRAAVGLSFRVPVHRGHEDEVFSWLAAAGLPLFVADAGGQDVRQFAVPPGTAGGFVLLVGNEGAGPRPAAVERAAALVALRLAPDVESLNAAVAGSILMWALNPTADGPGPSQTESKAPRSGSVPPSSSDSSASP